MLKVPLVKFGEIKKNVKVLGVNKNIIIKEKCNVVDTCRMRLRIIWWLEMKMKDEYTVMKNCLTFNLW